MYFDHYGTCYRRKFSRNMFYSSVKVCVRMCTLAPGSIGYLEQFLGVSIVETMSYPLDSGLS